MVEHSVNRIPKKLSKEDLEKLVTKVNEEKDLRSFHTPYVESSGRLPDFEVSYEVNIDPALSGLKLSQGMRCDYLYEGDDSKEDGIHMIWPEILDDAGEVILNRSLPLKRKGHATMWIGMHESRVNIHRQRLKIGTKGYWVIGSKSIANVEVTKILGLFDNEE